MKSTICGLTTSAMLLSMVTVAIPNAFALHETRFHGFAPSALPESGTEYLLTISGKARSVHPEGGIRFVGGDANLLVPIRPMWSLVEGKVLLKIAEKMSTKPSEVSFTVESGYISVGKKVYAVDGGSGIYNKRLSLIIDSGSDLGLKIRGGLSGGIPALETLSSVSQMQQNLQVDESRWLFDGGITMRKLA